jgi:hypothetical protein
MINEVLKFETRTANEQGKKVISSDIKIFIITLQKQHFHKEMLGPTFITISIQADPEKMFLPIIYNIQTRKINIINNQDC